MSVAALLNAVYTKFDVISEQHDVYKVCSFICLIQ